MTNNTQEKIIIDYLLDNGSVSRNWALRQYITRLGAIINRLNDNGWEIKGEYVKTQNGRDYVYSLIKSPIKKVGLYANGQLVSVKYERVV